MSNTFFRRPLVPVFWPSIGLVGMKSIWKPKDTSCNQHQQQCTAKPKQTHTIHESKEFLLIQQPRITLITIHIRELVNKRFKKKTNNKRALRKGNEWGSEWSSGLITLTPWESATTAGEEEEEEEDEDALTAREWEAIRRGGWGEESRSGEEMKAVEGGIGWKETPLEENGNDDRGLREEERRLWSPREEEAIDEDGDGNGNWSNQCGGGRERDRDEEEPLREELRSICGVRELEKKIVGSWDLNRSVPATHALIDTVAGLPIRFIRVLNRMTQIQNGK